MKETRGRLEGVILQTGGLTICVIVVTSITFIVQSRFALPTLSLCPGGWEATGLSPVGGRPVPCSEECVLRLNTPDATQLPSCVNQKRSQTLPRVPMAEIH